MTLEELKQKLNDNGYEETVIFENYDYAPAFLGVTEDGRAVYSYEKMIDYLMQLEGWNYEEAVEWIDYNTLRALPYMGSKAPIIMYRLEG